MTAQDDYDVIIVGAGGAGLAAANAAANAGRKVLLIEAGDRTGGSTALSQGAFYAANTSVQRAAGIMDDSADAMYRYAMALNQYRVDASLMRRFCDESTAAFHWLLSLGVRFPAEMLVEAGVEGLRRSHFCAGLGQEITTVMEGALQGKPVDIALRTRAQKLLMEEGCVRGVEANGTAVRARSVVIASGGFGANPEMVSRYYPEAAAHGELTWYIGSAYCIGDGLSMGMQVGADITGHNRGLLLATARFRKELELPPAWLVCVNRDGRRFMDESVAYAVMSGIIEKQRNAECFAILDATAFADPPIDPRFKAQIDAGILTTTWKADILAEQLQAGRVIKGDSLEELAQRAGIRWPALQTTIATYNGDVERGADSQFFKSAAFLQPMRKPPFYAVRLRSSILCFTSTGLRIDSGSRVLDTAGLPIPGLYAAGETAGGVMGERYLGSGNSIAHVITFGLIAGRNAAAYLVSQGA